MALSADPGAFSARPHLLAAVRGAVPAVLFGLLAARRWVQMGAYPTGIDAGNWLAFGESLFGGVGKATPGAYPPIVPVVMHLGQSVADPMLVAKVVGIASLVSVAVAVYVVARAATSTWLALLAAVVVVNSFPLNEAVAFGGYPQNYALALLPLAGWLIARYFAEGQVAHAILGGGSLAGAALTHHMYYLFACAVVAGIWLLWLTSAPGRRILLGRTAAVAVAGALSMLFFLPTLLTLQAAGYDPPINPSVLRLRDALNYAFIDAPWLWSGLAGFAAVYAVTSTRRRAEPVWMTAGALCGVSLLAFVATHEARLLPPLVMGSALFMALALRDFSRSASGWPLAIALGAPLIALAVALPRFDARANGAFDYYGRVDASLIATAEWLDAHPREGLVAVKHGRFGWPLGWWFEGLTDRDIAVGSNVKWLAFPEERQRARLASRFFSGGLDAQSARALARDEGVALLVFERNQWIDWDQWLADDGDISIAYQNARYMVLDLDTSTDGRETDHDSGEQVTKDAR